MSERTTVGGSATGDGATAQSGSRRQATRRGVLASCVGGVAGALAGCSGLGGSGSSSNATSASTSTAPTQQSGAAAKSPFASVYQSLIDSVVVVETSTGSGSGWVYDSAAHLVTNQHVVGSDTSVDVQYRGDKWRSASVLGTDGIGDLAVLEPTNPPASATPLSLESTEPVVGTDVALIGEPFELPGSLSVGVVSGTNRLLTGATGSSIPGAIQVDATANPGNSGGPMFTTTGSVVGVLDAGEGVAVNFGIPAELVQQVVPALVQHGSYTYPFLGVATVDVDPTVASANGLDTAQGVLVTDVTPGSAAAGTLRGSSRSTTVNGRVVPVGGDVVVEFAGQPIDSTASFAAAITYTTRPNDTVSATVLRNGSRQSVSLTLGSRSQP